MMMNDLEWSWSFIVVFHQSSLITITITDRHRHHHHHRQHHDDWWLGVRSVTWSSWLGHRRTRWRAGNILWCLFLQSLYFGNCSARSDQSKPWHWGITSHKPGSLQYYERMHRVLWDEANSYNSSTFASKYACDALIAQQIVDELYEFASSHRTRCILS